MPYTTDNDTDMHTTATTGHRLTLPALIIMLLCALAAGAQSWNDPARYRLNKVQPHDRVVPAGPASDAGRWRMSLDGSWRMALFATAQQATLSPTRWQAAEVPAALPDTGGHQAAVMARSFVLPPHWQGRRTIVKFGAAGPAMALYVNGREVGYSEDARTPAEWDITRYLREGTNELKVKLSAQCSGLWMEREGTPMGLTRSVELHSLPATHITDLKVVADLDTAAHDMGLLDVMVDLSREVSGGHLELAFGDTTLRHTLAHNDWFASFRLPCPGIEAWSDSTPTLYRLGITLFDANGKRTERIDKLVGFRHVAIADGVLRLNGRSVELKGVDYTPPDNDIEAMRRDISLMKSLGINAVRTAYYPADERWYDLCDSAGLLLFDEANINLDDSDAAALATPDTWLNPLLDRIYNMFRRDRNHPSVIAWSLAHGSTGGHCLDEAYRFLRGKDNTRPVVCGAAGRGRHTDIVMLPQPYAATLGLYGRGSHRRPALADGLSPFVADQMACWDTIGRHATLQGGFVGNWSDLVDSNGQPTPRATMVKAIFARSGALPDGGDKNGEYLWHVAGTPAQADTTASIAIATIACSSTPSFPRGDDFPAILADGLTASVGDWRHGWAAFPSPDTVVFSLTLAHYADLAELCIGTAHSPDHRVVRPLEVEASWSIDGRRWSAWQSLAPEQLPADPYHAHCRIVFSLRPKHASPVRQVRLRLVCRPTLPPWHPLAGMPAALMVDEVTLRHK